MFLARIRERIAPYIATPLVSIIFAAGCADYSASPVAPVTPPAGAQFSTAGSADAETLFRGIVMGSGPIADSIPEIRDNFKVDNLVTSSLSRATLDDLHNRIVSTVNAIDPNFLPRFKTAMNSGDPVTINTMLDEAFTISNDAVNRLTEGDTIRKLEADPAQVDQRLTPYKDANGNISLGDTLVTSTGASDELTNSTTTTYTGCTDENGQPVPCERTLAIPPVVVWFLGVHIAVVYNVAVAVVWGVYLAIDVPWRASIDSDLLRDQIVNSIALRLQA